MKKILISACLAGDLVRYDGKRKPLTNEWLCRWQQKGLLINVCPEVSGGLNTPRLPAEIVNGTGLDVLKGKARVMDIEGQDVTVFFIKGAEYALSLVKRFGIEVAILKERSPSCGVNHIYDGRFISTLTPGSGVTGAILRQNRIKVFSENELDQIGALLEGR